MSMVSGNMEVNNKERLVLLSINPKIYPLDVVFSSAYSFTDKYYVLVDGDPEAEIIVEIRPKDKKTDLFEAGREFNNELITYANYAVQALRNQRLREAIVDRVLMTNYVEPPENDFDEGAFSSEELQGTDEVTPWKPEPLETENEKPWFDDPEGIAVPWEEKYGDKSEKSKNKQKEE